MRPLWLFRLVFYPAAIGLAALLLADRLDAADPTGGWLPGATEQGHHFELRVQEGRPTEFNTHVVGDCSDGGAWYVDWHPLENTGVLRFTAPAFSAAETWSSEPNVHGRWTTTWLSMDGTLDDDMASGRVSMTTWVSWVGSRERVTCRTGELEFSARRPEH